jgi:hypothetical protein
MKKKLAKRPPYRPTKYKPEIFKKIEEYLSMCGRQQQSLPTIEGLADYLDITSETIRQWAKKYKDFSLTIKKLADKQKQQLIDDGMYGGKEINAAMAIFLLKVNHGMQEKSTTAIKASGKEMKIEFIHHES